MTSLKKQLKKLQNHACFLFPQKSRYNSWSAGAFSNIVELLLLLYYTSMNNVAPYGFTSIY